MFKSFEQYKAQMVKLVREIAKAAPSLTRVCYLSGSTPVSCEHLKHVVSMDLDWHSKNACESPGSGMQELKKHFGKDLKFIMVDHEFGMYKAELRYDDKTISIDAFSSFEDVAPNMISHSPDLGVETVALGKYLQTKLACLEDRQEIKDLYHLCALEEAGLPVQRLLGRIDQLALAEHIRTTKGDWQEEKSALMPDIPGLQRPSEEKFLSWVEQLEKDVHQRIKTSVDEPDDEMDSHWDPEL